MNFADQQRLLKLMCDRLAEGQVSSWKDIAQVIQQIQTIQHVHKPSSREKFFEQVGRGSAFITFAIGLDGVSIEIAKYARALEVLGIPGVRTPVHLIAGHFHPHADALMQPRWERFTIEGINGWDKWAQGEPFEALFFEDLAEGSQRSGELAAAMYRQARHIAATFGRYVVDKHIGLLIPVNAASNPGNLALALALVFVTEALGIFVLNSNHDFYWEGGRPPSERQAGDEAGVRDHFFHNIDHRPFFSLLEALYPWKGRRWLQVNINALQAHRLIEEFGFAPERVVQISTCVGDKLLDEFKPADVYSARVRMAHILSNGYPLIKVRSLKEHQKGLRKWMGKQKPRVIGARSKLMLDLANEKLIYLLQPTRVIARKRIERDVALIHALLKNGPLRDKFDTDPRCRIVLHITGPTPREHRSDLAIILHRYQVLIDDLPASISERVFLAFSVGRGEHPGFQKKGFAPLTIIDLYRLATAVLFPSETEGRGLPIIESAAVGVPIVSSRYAPVEVFDHVIGEHLAEDQRIQYLKFPDGKFSKAFLEAAANLLLRPEISTQWQTHNRKAVKMRYSEDALRSSLHQILCQLYEVST